MNKVDILSGNIEFQLLRSGDQRFYHKTLFINKWQVVSIYAIVPEMHMIFNVC